MTTPCPPCGPGVVCRLISGSCVSACIWFLRARADVAFQNLRDKNRAVESTLDEELRWSQDCSVRNRCGGANAVDSTWPVFSCRQAWHRRLILKSKISLGIFIPNAKCNFAEGPSYDASCARGPSHWSIRIELSRARLGTSSFPKLAGGWLMTCDASPRRRLAYKEPMAAPVPGMSASSASIVGVTTPPQPAHLPHGGDQGAASGAREPVAPRRKAGPEGSETVFKPAVHRYLGDRGGIWQ